MNAFDEAMSRALESPKYNVLTGRTPDISERAADIIRNFIEKYVLPLLARIPPFTGGGSGVNILYGIFIISGIMIISLIIYFYAANKKKRGLSMPVADILSGVDINYATTESLLKQAAAFAEAGMYRDAVRYGYIALLLTLDKKGLIGLSDSKTNGQFLREVKFSAPEISGGFGLAVAAVNYIWFGNKNIDAEGYNKNIAATSELIKKAGAVPSR